MAEAERHAHRAARQAAALARFGAKRPSSKHLTRLVETRVEPRARRGQGLSERGASMR
jgi:hypothetical protein